MSKKIDLEYQQAVEGLRVITHSGMTKGIVRHTAGGRVIIPFHNPEQQVCAIIQRDGNALFHNWMRDSAVDHTIAEDYQDAPNSTFPGPVYTDGIKFTGAWALTYQDDDKTDEPTLVEVWLSNEDVVAINRFPAQHRTVLMRDKELGTGSFPGCHVFLSKDYATRDIERRITKVLEDIAKERHELDMRTRALISARARNERMRDKK